MAKLSMSKRWDTARGKYVPWAFSITGDGPLILSREFMEEVNPEYVHVQGGTITIDSGDGLKDTQPIVLQVIARLMPHGHYICKLVSEARSGVFEPSAGQVIRLRLRVDGDDLTVLS